MSNPRADTCNGQGKSAGHGREVLIRHAEEYALECVSRMLVWKGH